MSFEHPIFLYAAAALFVLTLLAFARVQAAKRRILKCFISEEMLPTLLPSLSRFKMRTKAAMFALGLALIFASLARPQYGYVLEEEKSFGLDIIFAVDTSKSMLAEDVKPNRLERSKLAITDLVERLDSDRVGLVAFSGEAFLQCPLTLDYDAFRLSLEALDTDIIQRGGTNIAAAISEAESAFAKTKNHKVLILISDGEELEAAALPRAAEAFKNAEIKIYTLGVGGAKGETIPVRDSRGRLDYLRDKDGQLVSSRLNEELLTKIAESAGGFYAPLVPDGMDLIYEDGISKSEKSEFASKMRKRPIERFQIPLAIALILLALESVIGTRKLFGGRTANIAALALFISAGFIPTKGHAETQKSWREYFNEGVDAYEAKDFKLAKENFYKAVASNSNLDEHAQAFYNAGSADYESAKAKIGDAKAVDDARNASKSSILQATQALNMGAQTLSMGRQTLKDSGEEGLTNQSVQEQIKQAISQNEAAKKALEERAKQNKEASSLTAAVSSAAESAFKNFENAAELNPKMEKARTAADAARKGKETLGAISKEFKDFEEQSKESSAKISSLVEELKKLLREDDNKQNQDQNQEQNQNQNQDQQNSKDNSQDQQQNQNKDQQDQKNQDQQQDKNQENPEQNRQDKKDQSDSDKNNKDQAENKAQQDQSKDEGENSKEEQPQENDSKQDEQAVDPEQNEQQNSDSANSSKEEESKNEKSAESAIAPEESEETPLQENKASSLEKGEEPGEENQDFRATEGAMTKREAGQVLDTLKESEKKLPFSGYGTQKRRYEDKNYKDW